eukprot:gene16909-23204_t
MYSFGHDSNYWMFAKKVSFIFNSQFRRIGFVQCESECQNDDHCRGYYIYRNNINKKSVSNKTNLPEDYVDDLTCILVSNNFKQFIQKHEPLFHNFLLQSIVADKVHDFSRNNNYQIENLVHGPLVTDSTTVLTFQQSFFHGCSYTISVWAWLWKSKIQSDKVKVIFSSRKAPYSLVDDNYRKSRVLLPTILFNVGKNPNKFFFSIGKDRDDSYSGLWAHGYPIKYHTWIHLTMTINYDKANLYINGQFMDYIRLAESFPSLNDSPQSQCTVLTFNITYPHSEKANSSNNAHQGCKPGTRLNNTILQLSGIRNGGSSPGMFYDLMVIKNTALDRDQIKALMKLRPEPKLPTLTKLLPKYGVYKSDDICAQRWESNEYLMKSWGFCPDSVCGKICIVDHFFISPTHISVNLTTNQVQIDVSSKQLSLVCNANDKKCLDSTQSMNKRKKRSNKIIPSQALLSSSHKHGTEIMPDIGELRNNKRNNKHDIHDVYCSNYTFASNNHTSPFDHMSNIWTELLKKSATINNTNETYTNNHHKKKYYNQSSKSKAQSLYKAAMIWKHGRHEDMEDTTSLESLNEMSFSALALSLWFSDDASIDATDQDVDWNFKYPTMLGQPAHIALGYDELINLLEHKYHKWENKQLISNNSFFNKSIGIAS